MYEICLTCGIACRTCPPEHRGSRMPERPVDTLFIDAAFRPFSPEERAMVEEKIEPDKWRKGGAI